MPAAVSLTDEQLRTVLELAAPVPILKSKT